MLALSVTGEGSTMAYDRFDAPLADRIIAPDLSVGDVELLGSKKIGLVRGVWTPIDVEVANAGEGTAYVVKVSGRGKGVQVRPGTINDLSRNGDDPGTSTTTVMVKLAGNQKSSNLRLTAESAGVNATRSVKVRAVKAPPRPKPGRWGSSSVSFTVTGGKVPKVKGFRIRLRTECSSSAYATNNTYGFPTTPVARSGVINASDRGGSSGAEFTVGLEMMLAGTRATRGVFGYGGPAGCGARGAFTAKWLGR